MGIIRSKPQVEYYTDSYHITDTFSNHTLWKDTVKEFNHLRDSTFLYDPVNVPERFGSQPYTIYAVYDKNLKESIQRAAHDQPHLTACNCIFVFCARTNLQLHNEFPTPIVESSSIRSFFSTWWYPQEPDTLSWSTRQTYMALGFVITACAEESIPYCPVDSFSSISSLLALPSYLVPTVLLTIGAPD